MILTLLTLYPLIRILLPSIVPDFKVAPVIFPLSSTVKLPELFLKFVPTICVPVMVPPFKEPTLALIALKLSTLIFPAVTAPAAMFSARTALAPIFPAVTALAAIFSVVIAPARILSALTALVAIFSALTAPS